jgi:hypothetical protein
LKYHIYILKNFKKVSLVISIIGSPAKSQSLQFYSQLSLSFSACRRKKTVIAVASLLNKYIFSRLPKEKKSGL